jgi:SPP1 gp7 family putative phage head morphogenesis protein
MPDKISQNRKNLLRSRANISRRPIEPLHPDLIAAAYSKRLQEEVERGFGLVKKYLYPVLKDDVETLPDTVRADMADDADLINNTINRILDIYFGGMYSKENPNLEKYSRTVLKKLVDPMQSKVDKFNKTQFTRQFKRISGVDPLRYEPEISGLLEVAGNQNVNKIVTQSSNYFDQIQEMTDLSLRKGTSVAELAEDIQTLTGATKSQANLIAIDQVQKLNANLEEERQKNNKITRYIWRTRRNARVRSKDNSSGYSDHKGLEGAVFDWNFPPTTVLKGKRAGERNHPGNDITRDESPDINFQRRLNDMYRWLCY